MSRMVIGSLLLLSITFHVESQIGPVDQQKSFDHVNVIVTTKAFPSSSFLTTNKGEGKFALVENGVPSGILVSPSDHSGVLKVARLFQKDLGHVSGGTVSLSIADRSSEKNVVVIGTLGQSKLIDRLISERRIDVSVLKNKWEQFLIFPLKKPIAGIDNALVIVGSDKRGTIFGMFELSAKMGVSPWYWWADAPIQSRKNIYVKSGTYTIGEPKVQYRGIFINDEDPALSGWAREKFGGLNHHFYERVFELILRMKGNYLWPAMWGKSLWDDDSLSAPLANELGIVLSTSHHEPMMRAHVEWDRYGKGMWNYEKNKEELQVFWRDGMIRTQGQEKVVTLAMRGDGDEAMGEGTNIALLEKIVSDQRQIIAEVTRKPIEETPQVWALYKEVQDYYDKGMRVPDDVTLLFCDDNWGQVRILPAATDRHRKGGYGMYYHFDFVGGPRSYKWLNTVQIERVWEQMRLTYEHGVRKIWLTNVGDLKPMDLPINFFLDFAWNPDQFRASDLPEYYRTWSEAQFGGMHAQEIGRILALYTKYNARRKPELLESGTYSLVNFNEAENVVKEYQTLLAEAKALGNKLPKEAQDAYYQLVLFPVEACANVNEMYVAAAKNKLYRSQDRASTNFYADKVKALFFRDAELTAFHHNGLANGKWNHIMNQTHMGHVSWSDPAVNKMPEVSYIQVKPGVGLGYILESAVKSRYGRAGLLSKSFTPFDPINNQTYGIEIYNTGSDTLHYTLTPNREWIRLSSSNGALRYEGKIFVSIDWRNVPSDQTEGEIIISGGGREFVVKVPLRKFSGVTPEGFVENNGVLSIDATNFQKAVPTKNISWEVIPNLGYTSDAITTSPVSASAQTPGSNSAHLVYSIFLLDSGKFNLETWFSPTLNFQKGDGLVYAISIDEGPPLRMNLHESAKAPDWTYPKWWNDAVTNNMMKQRVLSSFQLSAGRHTIKYWVASPGLVLQKMILTRDDVDSQCYLGPPQSKFIK